MGGGVKVVSDYTDATQKVSVVEESVFVMKCSDPFTCPSLDPWVEPTSPMSPALASRFFTTNAT